MQIELTVGPSQLPLAIDTLATLLRRPSFTQPMLDRELKIMRNEFALVDPSMPLASAAWKAAYGEAGLDPFGTFDSIYRASPEKLSDVFERQFASDGLALTISGPVDLEKASQMGKALLAPRPKSHFEPPTRRSAGKPAVAQADVYGECRGAIVPGFKMPQTMAALAAALAVATELQNCFVIYTPSDQDGLVIVGRTESGSGLGSYIDSIERPEDLYGRGRALARQWVQQQLRTPSGIGYLRGLLLAQGQGNRPEMMLQAIDAMTLKQFEEGLQALNAKNAAIGVGSR
jgi:predicted Zn-dependent peptidase